MISLTRVLMMHWLGNSKFYCPFRKLGNFTS